MAKSVLYNFVKREMAAKLTTYRLHKSPLLYRVTDDDLLLGFYFEGSSYEKTRFRINVFVQPLYCPSDTVRFNFGHRLGNAGGNQERTWDLTQRSTVEQVGELLATVGVAWHHHVDSAEKLSTNGPNMINVSDLYQLRDVAYSGIRCGNNHTGKEFIEKAIHYADAQSDIPWCNAIGHELRRVYSLVNQNLGAALNLLDEFAQTSKQSLSLQ